MTTRRSIKPSWIVELEHKINKELDKEFPKKDFHVDLKGEYEIFKELDRFEDKPLALVSEIRIVSNLRSNEGCLEEKRKAHKMINKILSELEQK